MSKTRARKMGTVLLPVEPLGDARYRVSGGVAPHVVTIGNGPVSCDCADFRFRRRECKHIRAVVHHLIYAPVAVTAAAGPGLSDRDVAPAGAD